MSKDFRQVPDGVEFENNHANQVILAWTGRGGQGVPLRQTEVSDASRYAIGVRNKGTDGKHLQVTHSSGAPVLLDVTDDGVFASIAGGAASQPFFFPGMIIAWHGALNTWPAGWLLCDGTNGTPDLRNKFIIGAGSTYDLDDTVGSATINSQHTHVQNAHGHSHAHGYSVDHDHANPQTEPASTGGNNDEEGAPISGTGNTYSLVAHEHDVVIFHHDEADRATSIDAVGAIAVNQNAGSTAQSVLPPSVGLFYIKRVAA